MESNTASERYKNWRKRQEEKGIDLKKKDSDRMKAYRKKKAKNLTEQQKNEIRKREKLRKRMQRAKKILQPSVSANTDVQIPISEQPSTSSGSGDTPFSPYKCVETYSKAVLKCYKSLPSSPNKQKVVLKGVAKKIGLGVFEDSSNTPQPVPAVQEDKTVEKVKNFYYRPDIVYTCPGMSDTITVWEDGKKRKLTKYYLTVFLREAYTIFKQENPDCNVGLTKFCDLRPKNVLLLKQTPSEQCKCRIHENLILKLKSLNVNYSNTLWEQTLCDVSENSSCWNNVCEHCMNGKKIAVPKNPEKVVTFKEWRKSKEKKMKLCIEEKCLAEIYEMLITDFPATLYHVNIKRIQSQSFEIGKKSLKTRILQIDFAMAFSCEYQNEVQLALWSRNSVTLFTAAFFYRGECKTFVICSDTRNKDKDAVFVFVSFLYEHLSEKNSDDSINEVIWSDGPSSEFKNRFMVKLLALLSKKYQKTFQWKYFATSHGKGVIDGVGGNVKRVVKEKMMSQAGTVTVQNASDFASVASSLMHSTRIVYISDESIKEKTQCEKPWENVMIVPGISKYHQISVSNNQITCKKHALCETDISIKYSLE